MITMNYTYVKAHITKFVGNNKKYDAVVKEKLPQRKHTYSTTKEFISNNIKGSGTIRKIISRRHTRTDVHNPKRCRKKLDSPEISRKQIRESMARLHSKYMDSHNADHLSQLKLGKPSSMHNCT